MFMSAPSTVRAASLVALTVALLACVLPQVSAAKRSCPDVVGNWRGWGGSEEAGTYYNFTKDGRYSYTTTSYAGSFGPCTKYQWGKWEQKKVSEPYPQLRLTLTPDRCEATSHTCLCVGPVDLGLSFESDCSSMYFWGVNTLGLSYADEE